MRVEFWLNRWAEGRTGFHLDDVNPMLIKHFESLSEGKPGSVFMPLCGKSLDICWLVDKGNTVTGVEVSEQAISAFFDENNIDAERDATDLLEWWTAENIELACGDFFHLTEEDLPGVGLVYDRAALIAMPAELRSSYAAHLTSLLKPGTRMLLITLEYDQSKIDGPPFSVDEAEVQSLFSGAFDIEMIDSQDALDERFRDRGLSAMQEKAYILQRRGTA